jgi:hypothetical protein
MLNIGPDWLSVGVRQTEARAGGNNLPTREVRRVPDIPQMGFRHFGRHHPRRQRAGGSLAPERLDAIGRWLGMPERTLVLEHLEKARRHVAEGERHVAHQREIIAQKERDGHDTSMSKRLLGQFEELYKMHVADRDRLEQELDEISK